MAQSVPPPVEEVLLAPLEQVIVQVGQGLAQAQAALDLNSVAIARRLRQEPATQGLGLEAPWYHMVEVEVSLKLQLSLAGDGSTGPQRPPRAYAALFNASYQHRFQADASGASVVRMKIVSVPPGPTGGG